MSLVSKQKITKRLSVSLTLRRLTDQILRGVYGQARVAVGGKAAIKCLAELDVDLLIRNIDMLQVDAYELVISLRRKGFDKPIIGITAATLGHSPELSVAGRIASLILME